MLLQHVHSCIFEVTLSLFDDLTCLFGWWYRHSPVFPCHLILFNSQLTCDTTYIFYPTLDQRLRGQDRIAVGLTPLGVCLVYVMSNIVNWNLTNS